MINTIINKINRVGRMITDVARPKLDANGWSKRGWPWRVYKVGVNMKYLMPLQEPVRDALWRKAGWRVGRNGGDLYVTKEFRFINPFGQRGTDGLHKGWRFGLHGGSTIYGSEIKSALRGVGANRYGPAGQYDEHGRFLP